MGKFCTEQVLQIKKSFSFFIDNQVFEFFLVIGIYQRDHIARFQVKRALPHAEWGELIAFFIEIGGQHPVAQFGKYPAHLHGFSASFKLGVTDIIDLDSGLRRLIDTVDTQRFG